MKFRFYDIVQIQFSIFWVEAQNHDLDVCDHVGLL